MLPNQQRFKDDLLIGLKKEWKTKLSQIKSKKIVSIYFGGGTPTLFVSPGIKEILEWTQDLDLSPDLEITVEANPETVTEDLIKELKSYGVNRISIGVQSLNASSLKILDRTHSATTAIKAIYATKNAGIDNISIDLMYDLPHQTIESFSHTFDQVAQLPITHLSLYNLTFEPHTAFFKHRKKLISYVPNQKLSLNLLNLACDRLESMGLERYEISAFARKGTISRHNTGYWTGRPFLGLGPSAFSYWEGKRYRNIAHLKKYLTQDSPIDFEEQLPYPDNLKELLAVELRLLKGVDLKKYDNLPKSTLNELNKLHDEKYLKISGSNVKLLNKGLLFYDTVATRLI